MKKTINPIMVGGTASHYQDENGMQYAQFDADFSSPIVTPCEFNAHVQRMRDGSLYVNEKPRKPRSLAIALWRGYCACLSLTVQDRIQFTFSMDNSVFTEREIAAMLGKASAAARLFLIQDKNRNQ